MSLCQYHNNLVPQGSLWFERGPDDPQVPYFKNKISIYTEGQVGKSWDGCSAIPLHVHVYVRF